MKNFFLKITNKFFKLMNINPIFILPPYEYVQSVCNANIHKYLGLSLKDVKTWSIVGGYLGKEISTIKKNYPNVKINIFECSERYANKLSNKFKKNDDITVVKKAVSFSSGSQIFFETSLKGSGSLLKLGPLAKKSYNAKQQESFVVSTISLDDFYKDHESLDILQIDVQGAEKLVLEGATNLLNRTKAVLIEISILKNLYKKSCTFIEILRILEKKHFHLVLVGTDFNLTGNALFINSLDKVIRKNQTI
jgi:FkbM family methyltransferase